MPNPRKWSLAGRSLTGGLGPPPSGILLETFMLFPWPANYGTRPASSMPISRRSLLSQTGAAAHARFRGRRGPAVPSPSASARRLDELAANRCALLVGHRREALALAGVGSKALSVRRIRACRHGRDGSAGEKQSGSGCSERGTRFGIQLHDDLLDDWLPTKKCDVVNIRRSFDARSAQRTEVLDAHQIAEVSRKVRRSKSSVQRTYGLTSCNPLDPRHRNAHPELATGNRAIWLQRFQKKIFFSSPGHPVHA